MIFIRQRSGSGLILLIGNCLLLNVAELYKTYSKCFDEKEELFSFSQLEKIERGI